MNDNSIILNCETPESTLSSLAVIYDVSEFEIKSYLHNLDLDSEYKKNNRLPTGDIVTFDFFTSTYGEYKNNIDSIYWFHLSRVHNRNAFKEGILPLNEILDAIWDFLFLLFDGTEHHSNLKKLKQSKNIDFQYDLKSKGSIHWGPYAMLIKEVAFKSSETKNHDYLRIPEIIEDICNGYLSAYKESIYNQVKKSLTPCIVTFKSKQRVDSDCLKASIYYLYCHYKKENLSLYSNTCFDGLGRKIPYSDIVNIEFF